MENGDESLVVNPKLTDQIPYLTIPKDISKKEREELELENEKIAGQRRVISNHNTSSLFADLYSLLYGGRVNKGNALDTRIYLEGRRRVFSPDIIGEFRRDQRFTEVKGASMNGLPYCSLKQIENYAFSLLGRLESGDVSPAVNYAIFRYGNNSRPLHLDRLNNSQLLRRLSSERKNLTIIPFNLLLLLLNLSRFDTVNQTKSHSSVDFQDYLRPRIAVLTMLHERKEAIEKIVKKYHAPYEDWSQKFVGKLGDLHLDGLESENSMSPPIRMNYSPGEEPITISPFSITRYFLPEKAQKNWLAHFRENHARILGNHGLEDFFERSVHHEQGFFPSDDDLLTIPSQDLLEGIDLEDDIPF